MKITGPPYPSQGNPIPEDWATEGQWICAPYVFIAVGYIGKLPGTRTTLDPVGPASTPAHITPVHIDAERVASVLGISVEQVFKSNRNGEIQMSFDIVPPKPGALKSVKIKLRFPRLNLDRIYVTTNSDFGGISLN